MDWLASALGSGWLLTVLGAWLKARRTDQRKRTAEEKKIRDFLREKRLQLAGSPDLLAVVGFLREERAWTSRDRRSRPTPPPGFDGAKLRNLPAFLEPIGIALRFNAHNPSDAYDAFAEEVELCANSTLLWADEAPTSRQTYWKDFNQFALLTKTHRARRRRP